MAQLPSFKRTAEENDLIASIVQRAADLYAAQHGDAMCEEQRLCLRMDLAACHANGCPLRLADLLGADDFNLAHDVYGIHRHINRETGKLDGHFLPRFSA